MSLPAATVDLRPFACPLTYVKARIALDRLEAGDVLELWLRAGEPAESVPRSAEEDGHHVLGVEPLPDDRDAFRVLVRKGLAPAPGGLP